MGNIQPSKAVIILAIVCGLLFLAFYGSDFNEKTELDLVISKPGQQTKEFSRFTNSNDKANKKFRLEKRSDTTMATNNNTTEAGFSKPVQNFNVEKIENMDCISSTIDEVKYTTDAFNNGVYNIEDTKEQLKYYIDSCNARNINQIINNLITESGLTAENMELLISLFHDVSNTRKLTRAIQATDFNVENFEELVEQLDGQPVSLKSAFIPAILEQDDLAGFIKLTESITATTNTANTGDTPANMAIDRGENLIENVVYSALHGELLSNTTTDNSETFEYILETYPSDRMFAAILKHEHGIK